MTEPNAVLDRFAPQVRWITESLLRSFELEPHWEDDIRQDARILVLSYAGVIDGTHYGKLRAIEVEANGDEARVHSLVAVTLRLDLTQQMMRMLSRVPAQTSLHDLVENQEFDIEDPYSEADLYNNEQANRLLRQYPTLARNALEGLTQAQIAEADGVGHATVERRIAREKRAYLTDQLRRANLVVEGDESMGELEEAYTNVSKVRR